jgi:threonine/homoserine/homoserine lactone efflux protein
MGSSLFGAAAGFVGAAAVLTVLCTCGGCYYSWLAVSLLTVLVTAAAGVEEVVCAVRASVATTILHYH